MKKNFNTLVEYLRQWTSFLWTYIIKHEPVVWVDTVSGEETAENWSRRNVWVLRPRALRFLVKRLSCGCGRRLGRVILIRMECPKHGMPDLLGE